MDNNSKILTHINNLNSNFLFHASLGSKELFHSNLLAWLLEQENINGEPEALEIFLQTLPEIEKFELRKGNYEVKREEKKIDLVVKWEEEDCVKYVFIENKMKSTPTVKQLKEYNKTIEEYTKVAKKSQLKREVYRFLLTPLATVIGTDKAIDKKWQNITYKKTVLKFLESIKSVEFKNQDVKLVVERYETFLQSLVAIIEEFKLEESALMEFKKGKYAFYSLMKESESRMIAEYGNKNIMHQISDVRLADLILKLIHQNISTLIKLKINDSLKTEIVDTVDDLKTSEGNIFVSSGFTRKEGITDIKICLREKSQFIGLQLQGNTLKYLVEVFDNGLRSQNIRFARKIEEIKLWFYEGKGEGAVLLSGNGREKSEDFFIRGKTTFNTYNKGSFLYLNRDVSSFSEKSIDELANLIAEEIIHVLDNIDEFRKLIPNHN